MYTRLSAHKMPFRRWAGAEGKALTFCAPVCQGSSWAVGSETSAEISGAGSSKWTGSCLQLGFLSCNWGNWTCSAPGCLCSAVINSIGNLCWKSFSCTGCCFCRSVRSWGLCSVFSDLRSANFPGSPFWRVYQMSAPISKISSSTIGSSGVFCWFAEQLVECAWFCCSCGCCGNQSTGSQTSR